MKDFTPTQVKRWVAQEAAKHTTPESRAVRIASEREFVTRLIEMGIHKTLPNSFKAHRDLVLTLMDRDVP